jgi:hypothetical protein
VWAAWHIKGAAGTLYQWLDLTEFERRVISREVQLRIDEHNSAFPDDDF